jgi:hypothetical protein
LLPHARTIQILTIWIKQMAAMIARSTLIFRTLCT